MMKINFKQPKYIFPLVVFVPLCALVYFVMQTFGGGGDTRQTVATDRINMELPEANAEEAGDKMTEMSRRFGDEDAFTAVGAIGEEEKDKEELEHGYSEEELNRLDAAEAERIRQQQEMEELERSLAESRKHINSYAYGSSSSGNVSQDDFARDLEEIQRRSRKPSRADWVSAIPKRKKRPENNGRIPSPRYAWRKKNATGRTLSSNHPMPVPESSIRYRHPMKRRKPT